MSLHPFKFHLRFLLILTRLRQGGSLTLINLRDQSLRAYSHELRVSIARRGFLTEQPMVRSITCTLCI